MECKKKIDGPFFSKMNRLVKYASRILGTYHDLTIGVIGSFFMEDGLFLIENFVLSKKTLCAGDANLVEKKKIAEQISSQERGEGILCRFARFVLGN